LRVNWRAVASLAIGAVALTIVAVALVARWLVPDMSWAVAIALGAIVAPPDAAAATAVLKQLRPPQRLLVVLEGESLFNDASALLVYRLAVGATITGALAGWSVVPTLLVVTLGSIVLGLVLERILLGVIGRIDDVATAVVFQFCGTFGVWMLAERLHLSGIITMVVFAIAAARHSAALTPARIRIPSYAVWEVAVFVLNVLAFILVGFQLKSIAARVTGAEGTRYAIVSAVVCVAVILARIAWVTGAAAFSRWRCRPRPDNTPGPHDAVALTAGGAAVVGWCGMRGTVTLAAALALPTGAGGGAPFPYRDLILVTAFGVVIGTLVFQGLTLRPLLLRLKLEDDGTVDREVRHARIETLQAATKAAAACPGAETVEFVRLRYDLQLRRAQADLGAADEAAADAEARKEDEAVVRAATEAARQRLVALRANGTIGDAAFQRVEQELDWAELDWAQFLRSAEGEG
ncbi:MAG TPA: sodium:proton antiporter, partial [Thermoanaerobaculia bacterium]|nr:sodium:proton antiporter [Thermoanaerobaculia bacterium]